MIKMEIEIDFRLSIQDNAAKLYDKAKKLEKKVEKGKEALKEMEERIIKQEKTQEKEQEEKKKHKAEWYEKFRWFISIDGFLVIGGRDATTNEQVIKKYTKKHDIVLHADVTGSPFIVIRSEGKKVPKTTIKEAAIATASYSRAWRAKYGAIKTYWVNPDQLSKKPPAGEYIAKGAFMIYGTKNYLESKLEIGISWDGERVIAGPISSIKHKPLFVLTPGDEEASEIAKKINKEFHEQGIKAKIDDIIRVIPAGKSIINKTIK